MSFKPGHSLVIAGPAANGKSDMDNEAKLVRCLEAMEELSKLLMEEDGQEAAIVVAAASIHFGNLAGVLATRVNGGAESFLNELMLLCRANADDQAGRHLARLYQEGGSGS